MIHMFDIVLDSFKSLLRKQRNAFSINACLNTKKESSILKFAKANLLGGIRENMDEAHKK